MLVGTIRLYLYTDFDAITTNCLGDVNRNSQNLVKMRYIYVRLHEYYS